MSEIFLAKESIQHGTPRKIVGYFTDPEEANAWFDQGKCRNMDRDVEVAYPMPPMTNVRQL